jgi:hypothetical protein
MNRDLQTLARGPLLIAALALLVVGAQWALVSQGANKFIVPPPDRVGQQFFTSLKAHNFQAAHDQLSEDLRQQVSADDLEAMTERLEQATQGIHQANGENPHTQGRTATADVKVKLENGHEQTVQVPFTQEQGLWQITSLAPLEALGGTP